MGKSIWLVMADSIRPYYEFYLNHAFEEDRITEFDHYYQKKRYGLKHVFILQNKASEYSMEEVIQLNFSHGEIAVESKVGVGTSFIIKLPLVKELDFVTINKLSPIPRYA